MTFDLIVPQSSQPFIFDHGIQWGEFHDWNWNGFKCHWRLLGKENKQPLVFIHGFGASSAHWRKNAAAFAKAGFRVYALDLIGFGLSEQPLSSKQEKLDNFFWAQQLIAFLEDIAQVKTSTKAVLIGNSLGALVAINTVSIRPDLVKAVVASPLPDPAFMQPFNLKNLKLLSRINDFLVKLFFKLLPLEIFVPLIARTSILRMALQFAYSQSISRDYELLKLVATPAQRRSAPRALRAMCIGMSTRPFSNTAPFLLKQLSESIYRRPILLLWGREDKLVPLNIAKLITKQHPWLELSLIDHCGHCVHDELDQEFNQNVLSWLYKRNLSFNTEIS